MADLSPLKGMPLEVLSLSSNTRVSDLSALRGMPLGELRLRVCDVITDLSPLEDVKGTLRLLVLPPKARNVELLRRFPGLERISFADDPKGNYRPDRTVAEFWGEYDSREAHAHARAGRWAEARARRAALSLTVSCTLLRHVAWALAGGDLAEVGHGPTSASTPPAVP